ncbi:MAG: Na(+)/H(+) antiporter subunit D [Candidatus Aminicenantes bacterium]|nr:Na(+)/H(+) antiporter subunit D [Candidatus Aminicenantes bacterium]
MTGDWGILPPALAPFAGAVILPLLPKKFRSTAFLVFTLAALALAAAIPDGASLAVRLMGYELVLLRMDALARVFGLIFAFIAFAGGLYGFHLKDAAQQAAALLYAGSALGVVFAGDLFTLLVFWEVLALASTYLVWARRAEESLKAGFRYLMVHLFGGGMLLAGVILHAARTGSFAVERLTPDGGPAVWLILAGVALNAAVPPIHAWLPDAYPRATITGAVFMSAFTTKAAVYVLIRVFPGWKILLVMGVLMTIYGVVFAVLADDIRRILSYHIISQVGYMVAGAGLGTEMALNGSAAHAYSHILYKALLFMGAGAVIQTTGRSKLSELGGLAGRQKAIFALYMIAAFSISGAPLFNGFISKSMVVAAADEAGYPAAMLLLVLASVGTFLSVGLKLPYFTWFGPKTGAVPGARPPRNMLLGMGLVAALCVGYGAAPSLLYRILPFPVEYRPYTGAHLAETIQILAFTFAAFWLFRKILKPKPHELLDLDWFYRRPAAFFRRIFVDAPAAVYGWTDRLAVALIAKAAAFGRNPAGAISGGGDYSPDRYRQTTQALILLALGLFIVLALAVII